MNHHVLIRFLNDRPSAGGLLLGLEALLRTGTPQVFIDTMGYPLTLPLFRWVAGSTTAAYVHYPFIRCALTVTLEASPLYSSDMLTDVSNNVSAVHTRNWIAGSPYLRRAKLAYYRFLARVYSWAGYYSCMMSFTNGVWTDGHIRSLWKKNTILLHPPCPVKSIEAKTPVSNSEKLLDSGVLYILSIGQFRPEKNHRLQIEIMHELVTNATLRNANGTTVHPMLVMFGSCRNKEDMRRVSICARDRRRESFFAQVDELKQYADEMGVGECIHWMLNAPYEALQKELSEALIFLHTMRDEHFGIGAYWREKLLMSGRMITGVVEAMAAGTIAVAHNSGGPRLDIVLEGCGFLATTAKEYAAKVQQVLSMGEQARKLMRKLALKQVYQFDEEYFMQKAKKFGDLLHQ